MILDCTCKHDFQDKIYGAGRRVFNQQKKSNSFRCTVCGVTKTHGSSSDEKNAKAKK